MADEAGIPRVKGLRARPFGGRDMIMYGCPGPRRTRIK
jgi:hypothetical protein